MTTTTSRRSASTPLATAAIASFSCWALALLLLHVLRSDRALTTTWISGYALGPYGWVMTMGWLAASCGCVMLVLGLAKSGPRTGAAKLGRLLLGILAIGMLITAIFPPDKQGQPSLSGEIHSISFLVNVTSILLSSVLLSIGFGSDPRWRAFQRTAAILAALLAAAFILQFVTAYLEVLYGLANRLFALVLIVWLLLTSIRLRAVERGATVQLSPSSVQ